MASILTKRSSIKYIKNPSYEVQLLAVSKNARNIMHIKDPSYEIQLLAVSEDPSLLRYIENPSEEIKWISLISSNGSSIVYIKNPTYEMKSLSIKINPFNGEYIADIPEDLQLYMINNNPIYIRQIINSTEKVQHLAINSVEYNIFTDIQNPYKSTCLLALKKSYLNIKFIPNNIRNEILQDEELLKKILKEKPSLIKYIDKEIYKNALNDINFVTECIKKHPSFIRYVEIPTLEMLELASYTKTGFKSIKAKYKKDKEDKFFKNISNELKLLLEVS